MNTVQTIFIEISFLLSFHSSRETLYQTSLAINSVAQNYKTSAFKYMYLYIYNIYSFTVHIQFMD